MKKTRNTKRRHLIFYLKVFDEKTNELIGHLADITTKGIMLVSEKPVATNQTFNLKMVLPESFEKKEYLNFSARSLWCKNDVNPLFYDTGFELLDSGPEEFSVIEEIIGDFGFRES